MTTRLAIQVVSTFVPDPIAAPLGCALAARNIAQNIRVASPSQLSAYMLTPSLDSEDTIGTIVLARLEDWLRDLAAPMEPVTDNVARQQLRSHIDEFLSQVAILALRGRPVWLMTCLSTGWIAEEFRLATLCRTMANLLSARIRNLQRVRVLDWPLALLNEDCCDRQLDRTLHAPFTPAAWELLGESIASQLARSLASDTSNGSALASTGSPELAAFLAGLRVQVHIAPATQHDRSHVDRILRTAASFSLAGEKPTIAEAEINTIIESGNCLLISVSDRLSDYGPSGVVLAHETADTLLVDSLSLSCTVLGKQVEHALLSALAQIAADRQLSKVVFEYRSSGRNQPALAFLTSVADAETKQSYVLPVSEADARISTSAVAPKAWSLKIETAEFSG